MKKKICVNARGQIAIPVDICKKLGLQPGTEVDVDVSGDTIFLKRKTNRTAGAVLISMMTGKGDIQITTDEVMQLTRGE